MQVNETEKCAQWIGEGGSPGWVGGNKHNRKNGDKFRKRQLLRKWSLSPLCFNPDEKISKSKELCRRDNPAAQLAFAVKLFIAQPFPRPNLSFFSNLHNSDSSSWHYNRTFVLLYLKYQYFLKTPVFSWIYFHGFNRDDEQTPNSQLMSSLQFLALH